MTGIPIVGEDVKKDDRWWTEYHLERWAVWMSSDTEELPVGHANAVLVGENYRSLDGEYDRADGRLQEWQISQTDLVIAGLPEAERLAVRHRYLGETYPFDEHLRYEGSVKTPYGIALANALPLITAGLRRRGVWLGS